MVDENVNFMLGPTNTGKTHYAIERMLSYSSAIIGLPLRLLAREVYDKLVKKLGPLKVALITGEERIVPRMANYHVATVEAMPTDITVDFIAVDEIQLCEDFERGHIFTDKLLYARGNIETLFLGSDSMTNIVKSLFPYSKIQNKARRSNLIYTGRKRLYSLPKRSAVIAFKINEVYNIAAKIKALKGGAAVVIGALSPQTRNSQVSMFEDGTVDYIVASDAIGMGLNLNIKNVSMSSLKKYDGKKFRSLKNSELGQIVGRSGRNKIDGTFGTTLNCPLINSNTVRSIEKHDFEAVNFLYWRSRDLDFSGVPALINSLETKSNIPQLVKTQNTRDENLLKYLASMDAIKNKLNSYESIKLLWEICTVPDYQKNMDYGYSNDLVKIFLSILDKGSINSEWAQTETKKLHNINGSLDMLTLRLSKIRFWNYISNKQNWLSDNIQLKELSMEIEKVLSFALHKRLTDQFVDNKLHSILKEYNVKKNIIIYKDAKNNIVLNNRIIGKIHGLKLLIYDEKSIFKNQFLKNQISTEMKTLFKQHIDNIIKENVFFLEIKENYFLFLNNEKIGSIFRGESICNPKILLENNKFLRADTYQIFLNILQQKVFKKIQGLFWNMNLFKEINNKNLKAIFFSLDMGYGIILKCDIIHLLKKLTKKEYFFLKEKNIVIGKKYIYYKKVIEKKHKDERWILSSLHFNYKFTNKIPQNNVFTNANNYDERQLKLIGYIKIGKYAIQLEFLEIFLRNININASKVICFTYIHFLKYDLNFNILKEILNFLGYVKVAGTNLVSYWGKNKNLHIRKNYDSNSPFYILKKLQ